jgi:hypothetical protein
MITLAVSTNAFDCCTSRVNVRGSLTSIDCGRTLGQMNLRRRPLEPGDDGLRYVSNTWLILGDPGTWDDEKAVLTVEVEPYGGGESISQTLPVTPTLSGGTDSAQSVKLGTSDAGETSPDGFCALPTYAQLTPQSLDGSHLGLVFAARTAAFGPEVAEVDIDATLTTSVKADPTCESTETTTCPMIDVELGRVVGRRQPIVRRDDGRAYLFGLPLTLNDDADWAGKSGTLTLTLTPAGGGNPVSSSASLTLIAPPG